MNKQIHILSLKEIQCKMYVSFFFKVWLLDIVHFPQSIQGSKFGSMTYSIIGDDGSSQKFLVDSSSGEITQRVSLQAETKYLYRVSTKYRFLTDFTIDVR